MSQEKETRSPSVDLWRVASRLATCAEIRNVHLVHVDTDINHLPTKTELAYNLNVTPQAQYQVGDDAFGVVLQCELILEERAGRESEAERLARLTVAYGAVYAIGEHDGAPIAEDEVSAFAATTGQFALYPYVREFFQTLTSRAGFPTLTLGIMRMGASTDWV